ncbi:MAG: DUF4367 domain-containing protein [Oscillospiraceae bacterium]|nr:DUF4367 domain-containing protein [Oscillospiraceae bacterium]
MNTNKEAAREVLRRCMQAEFAHIPAEQSLPDDFSPVFDERVARGRRRRALPCRRALIAAAMLAACFVLVAWTPVGGMVVDLLTTAYENIVDYHPGPGLRTEIETLYAPSWLPEGFEEVSREWWENNGVDITYRNDKGDEVIFSQTAADSVNAFVDNENAAVFTKKVGEWEVLFSLPDGLSTATWTQDLYLMDLVYRGEIEITALEQIILSVAPEA